VLTFYSMGLKIQTKVSHLAVLPGKSVLFETGSKDPKHRRLPGDCAPFLDTDRIYGHGTEGSKACQEM
jgi:hypothetical protein